MRGHLVPLLCSTYAEGVPINLSCHVDKPRTRIDEVADWHSQIAPKVIMVSTILDYNGGDMIFDQCKCRSEALKVSGTAKIERC